MKQVYNLGIRQRFSALNWQSVRSCKMKLFSFFLFCILSMKCSSGVTVMHSATSTAWGGRERGDKWALETYTEKEAIETDDVWGEFEFKLEPPYYSITQLAALYVSDLADDPFDAILVEGGPGYDFAKLRLHGYWPGYSFIIRAFSKVKKD